MCSVPSVLCSFCCNNLRKKNIENNSFWAYVAVNNFSLSMQRIDSWNRNGCTASVPVRGNALRGWLPPPPRCLCALLLAPSSQLGSNCLNFWSQLSRLIYLFIYCLERIKVLIWTAFPTDQFKTSSKRVLMSSWGSNFFLAQAAPREDICAYP